jgi:hypothetical protein
MMSLYYQEINYCLNYRSYQFSLAGLEKWQYEMLKRWINSLGDNQYPNDFPVLRIKHPAFMIEFPSYGFPYFKVMFAKTTSTGEIQQHLCYMNEFLDLLHAWEN